MTDHFAGSIGDDAHIVGCSTLQPRHRQQCRKT
jgi:hypothetical protein